MISSHLNLALSSDFPSTVNPDLVTHIRAVGSNPRIAWVAPQSTAARLRFPMARLAFRACGFKRLEHIGLGKSASAPAIGDLEPFDVVYLTGGDPLIFRETLQQSGLAAGLRAFAAHGKLVVAASGGAMQLTPNVSLFRLLANAVDDVIATRDEFRGLGLVDFELLPHLNRHDAAFLEKVRRYSERVPHDIVALEDGAAVLCESGGSLRRGIGTGVRYRDGVQGSLE